MINLEIRTISKKDIKDIVEVHIAALPFDVLPHLGDSFLIDYYNDVINDSTQILFGAFERDSLVGFCQLSIEPVRIIHLLCNSKGVVNTIRLLLFHPVIVFSGIVQLINRNSLDKGTAEISIIAVSPNNQRKGAGQCFLDHLMQYCKKNYIVTLQTKTANQYLLHYYKNRYNAYVLKSFSVLGTNYYYLRFQVE